MLHSERFVTIELQKNKKIIKHFGHWTMGLTIERLKFESEHNQSSVLEIISVFIVFQFGKDFWVRQRLLRFHISFH